MTKGPGRSREAGGPDPERLKIEMPWEDAVRRVIRKDDPPPRPTRDTEKREGGDD